MKTLNKYLNTKAQWHPGDEFPRSLTKKLALEWLKKHNIEYIDFVPTSMIDIYNAFENCNNPSYIMDDSFGKDKYWIRIAKPGKICKDNPMYTFEQIGNDVVYSGIERRDDTTIYLDYIELAKRIEKVFG